MALQTRSGRGGGRRYAVVLEAPGNIARELALYRRRLFAAYGEGSALAFPEVVPLYFGRRPGPQAQSLRRPGLIAALERAWEGCSGGFRFESLLESGEELYLQLAGPLRELGEALLSEFPGQGFEADAEPPLLCGAGLFVCRPAAEQRAAVREAASAWAPKNLQFTDASLSLLRLDLGVQPFAAQSWRELARAKRRTGPKV